MSDIVTCAEQREMSKKVFETNLLMASGSVQGNWTRWLDKVQNRTQLFIYSPVQLVVHLASVSLQWTAAHVHPWQACRLFVGRRAGVRVEGIDPNHWHIELCVGRWLTLPADNCGHLVSGEEVWALMQVLWGCVIRHNCNKNYDHSNLYNEVRCMYSEINMDFWEHDYICIRFKYLCIQYFDFGCLRWLVKIIDKSLLRCTRCLVGMSFTFLVVVIVALFSCIARRFFQILDCKNTHFMHHGIHRTNIQNLQTSKQNY